MYNGGQNFLNLNRTRYSGNQQTHDVYANQNTFVLPQINQFSYLPNYFPQQQNQQYNYQFGSYMSQQPSVNNFTLQQYNFFNVNQLNVQNSDSNIKNVKQKPLSKENEKNKGNKKNLKKRYFTKEEDMKLKRIVESIGSVKSWKDIADMMPGRSARQCRERYLNYLANGINSGAWSKHEDKLLLRLQSEIGNEWVTISRIMGNGRSENNVKNRFYFLIKEISEDFKKEKTSKKDIGSKVVKHIDSNNEQIISPLDPKIFEEIDKSVLPKTPYISSEICLFSNPIHNEINEILSSADKSDKIFYFDENDFGLDYF